MKGLGKRQKKDRARARVSRFRVVESSDDTIDPPCSSQYYLAAMMRARVTYEGSGPCASVALVGEPPYEIQCDPS
jgi:hypothetical protein